MSDIEKLPREYPEVDSRMSYEQEQNAQDILARKGINIDWTTGTIQAKNFIGSGTGLWDVGEGTGTGPKGDPGNDGNDGKDFTYDMFTQDQLDGLQGPKGDPFVYKDFTPSQLAGLKGPAGNDGKDYDQTVLDNLDKKVEKNTADVSTNRSDIAKEVVRNDEQDATLVDLQDQLDNIDIPETDLDDLITKEEFDEHEKRNAASFVLVEAELLRMAEEVIFNYRDIEVLYQEKIPAIESDVEDNAKNITANTKALEDKASKSEENIFNAKQTFNKNVTFKGSETALIPPLSSRWHKYTVNPPKNAEGGNDTSEAYGVNYYLDAGNTWKNQFKISNRHGTAFEVRGGADVSGQLHSKWTYTGSQEEDNDIATVKYVNDAVEEYAVPLDGNTTKTGSLILKTDSTTPFEVQSANGSPIFKMWSSGAVALEKPYTEFKDNELVTKAYVDGKVSSDGGSSTGYPPISEYDFYYLSSAGTTAGRITLHDFKGDRTTDLSKVTLVAFSGVDKNGKRWARDEGAESYEKVFYGTLNLMTEEGKTVLKMCAGKGTSYANLYYFKNAIPDFVPDDTYLFEVIGADGIELTSRVSEITYPQKLNLHVSGLHF